MKITFIGTSHGVPEKGRACSCTMIEINDAIYLVDAGGPVIDWFKNNDKDVNKIKAIFTTHAHGDHVNGLIPIVDLVNWYYKNASFDIYVTEQPIADAICGYTSLVEGAPICSDRLRFKTVDKDFVYDDGNIRVTLIPTKHMEKEGRPTYAILISAEGKKIVLSGDLSYKLEKKDLPAIVSESETDLFVCEMAHFGVEHVLPYLDTCLSKKVCFTHVFPHSKLDEIRALDGKYAFPVITPSDGDEIMI